LPRRGYRFIGRVDDIKDERRTLREEQTMGPHKIQSLAVLPLDDHSDESKHEYFADGMTEALITNLAKIKALRVISRTSAMQYKGVSKSLPRIARELNVDAIIQGSVLRSGDRIRITVQIIDATTDRHLWAESYERDLRDILSLQSDIARQVANEVRIILTPEEYVRLGQVRKVDPQAHELYLQGRYYWNKRTQESVRKALAYFLRAIDQDPSYVQGYAGSADAYNILGYYNALAPAEAYPKAKAAALRALEIDDSSAEPHAALGVVKRDFEWDWKGAQQEFWRANQLNPGYVEAYHWHSTLLSMLGQHDEALLEKKKTLAMDPRSVVIRTDLARMFYFHREYDRAIEEYGAALEMDPTFSSAHLWLAQPYEQKGMFEQAMGALEIGCRLAGNSCYAVARLGLGHALAGNQKEAHAVLNHLNQRSTEEYVSPYDIAMIRTGLNESDEAFACLENALAERSVWLGYLNVEPQWDTRRSDPRFRELLRRVSLSN
jgi:TolB-like protein/Tfp pilus assembly protein PilF